MARNAENLVRYPGFRTRFVTGTLDPRFAWELSALVFSSLMDGDLLLTCPLSLSLSLSTRSLGEQSQVVRFPGTAERT